MPNETLEAFYDHGDVGAALPPDGGNADELLELFANAGINTNDLAAQLQRDGATSFVSVGRPHRPNQGAVRLRRLTSPGP